MSYRAEAAEPHIGEELVSTADLTADLYRISYPVADSGGQFRLADVDQAAARSGVREGIARGAWFSRTDGMFFLSVPGSTAFIWPAAV